MCPPRLHPPARPSVTSAPSAVFVPVQTEAPPQRDQAARSAHPELVALANLLVKDRGLIELSPDFDAPLSETEVEGFTDPAIFPGSR